MIRVVLAALFGLLAAPAWAEIEITPITSPGGITAWLYEDQSLPILTIEASVQGGAALDPAGKAGATSLMTALVSEGAGDLDATAFAEAREDLAARIGFGAGRDEATMSVTMLTETQDAALELARLALTAPRFDAAAVERLRAQVLSGLAADETSPRGLAGRAFQAAAFPDHPLGRPVEGTPETVAALTAADLRAAHAAAFTRDRLRVAVVGAITPEALGPVLDRLFGDLPARGPDLPPVAEPALRGETIEIGFDGPQTVISFGQAGLMRDDPDFIAGMVMDHVLGGGGFESRLTQELREKRGLTYGVYTYLAPGDFGAVYAGSVSTANANAGEVVAILREEWARMAEAGVTEAELAAAKRYLTGAYPLNFDGNARIAGQVLGLQTEGLGIDYVNRRNALVEAVTAADVARVAARLLQPQRLTLVVVGRPEGLAQVN